MTTITLPIYPKQHISIYFPRIIHTSYLKSLFVDIISEQTTETQELEASNLKLIADLETMDEESDELEQTLVCVRREVEALTVQIQHLQAELDQQPIAPKILDYQNKS